MVDPWAKSYNTHLCFPSVPNDHSDSGVCSPTMWRTSHRAEDYWSLSPDSKAQAIARGQRELMDMVSKMPESCYELSLKDLVEVRGNEENDRKVFEELPKRANSPSKAVRKTRSDKWVDPNQNSGFLLKMMFPVSLGSRKDAIKTKTQKNKKKKDSIKDSQVSPRPSISEEAVKTEDIEWWNRLSDSKGNASTKKSQSSSNRSQRDKKSSCLYFWRVRSRG